MLPLHPETNINRVRSRRRCRKRQPSSCDNPGVHFFRFCSRSVVILALSRWHHSFTASAYTYSSPLFRSATIISTNSRTRQDLNGKRGPKSYRASSFGRKGLPYSSSLPFGTDRSSALLRMVLTTPESIIEQASTQKLLDVLLDESTRTTARRPIMMQFDPSSGAIWRRWKGTVFSETWVSCLRNVIYSLVVLYIYRSSPRMEGSLSGFDKLWGQLLSVTTFTLTFFVNQSYALWRKCYGLSRRLQGRLHDIDMTLAMHAARKIPSRPNEPSTYTAASRQLLDLVSRYVRLFNLLTYASFTRSHRPILTPRGMRRLVERGLMTAEEREILMTAEVPATQRHNCVLMWITRIFIEGRQAGHFTGGSGFEQQFMEKIHVIRSQYGAIGDELQGRMPLAYAHIVQVLVDCVLMMYPLMAFTSGMAPLLGVIGTGLLTTSYQGLFDLAKQFLDPYDNENYGRGEDPLSVDTLIAETNAGSLRWMYGFEQFPVSSQRIKDGELFDYLLPVRGYSVEDLERMEEERLQKLEELKLEREREEAERLKREEEEEAERLKYVALERTSGVDEVDEEEEWEDTDLVEEDIPFETLIDMEEIVGVEDVRSVEDGQDIESTRDDGKSNQTVTIVNAVSTALSAASFNATTAEAAAKVAAVGAAVAENPQSPELSPMNTTTAANLKPKSHTVTFLADGTAVSLTNEEREKKTFKDNAGSEPEASESGSDGDSLNLYVPGDSKAADSNESVQEEPLQMLEKAAEMEIVPKDKPDIKTVSSEALVTSNTIPDQLVVNGAPATEASEKVVSIETGDPGMSDRAEKLELYMLESQPTSFVPELEDFESFRELPWFDEVGPDGQEVRLSQMLADEEWEEERVQAAITLEEYQQLQEEAKNEMLETEQILSASPGDQGLGSKEEKSSRLPAYDQTKLDSISQLWGLPPDELEELRDSAPKRDIPTDETSFDNINQLWGQPSNGPLPPRETIPLSSNAFQSINELWNENGNTDSVEDTASRADSVDIAPRYGDDEYKESDDVDEDDLDLGAYEGFDWHDDDGDRLSQILADEVWDYVEKPPEEEAPITLEDYTKKVVEILEAAEDEILETEAILRAPPGADYFIEKEDDAEERVLQALNETIGVSDKDEDDLDALEMDMDYEEFVNATAFNNPSTDAIDFDSPEGEEFVSFIAKQANATRSFPEEDPSKKVQPVFPDNSGDSESDDDALGESQEIDDAENDNDPNDSDDPDDSVDPGDSIDPDDSVDPIE